MSAYELKQLRDVSVPSGWMWVWFAVSTVAIGVICGFVFATQPRGNFNAGAFLGGLLGGAISNIPAMAIFVVLKKILESLHVLRLPSVAAPAQATPPRQSAPRPSDYKRGKGSDQ